MRRTIQSTSAGPLALLLALLLVPPGAVAGQTPELAGRSTADSVTVFTHVHLLPLDADRMLADQTVVVQGGRIIALGPAGHTPIPAGASVIDGSGWFLLPGLIDCHVHETAPRDMALFLAKGVTTIRVMRGSAELLRLRDRIRAHERLGPDIFLTGPTLHGPIREDEPPGNTGLIREAEDGRAAVRAQAAAGYDFIKVYGDLTADGYRGIVEEAAARGLPVVGHVPLDVGLEGALAARQHSIEHLRGYEYASLSAGAPVDSGPTLRDRMLAWPYADEGRMAEAAMATGRAGTWNCPTLVLRVLLPADEIVQYLQSEEGQYVPATVRGRTRLMDRARVPWAAPMSDEDFEQSLAGRTRRLQMVRALQQAGAKLAVGTDAGVAGFSMHEEMALMRAAGLSPFEVLAAATRGGAGMLGVEDRGIVSVGMRADLLLVAADPRQEPATLARPLGVMANGRWHSRAVLDRYLEEHRVTAPPPLQVAPASEPGSARIVGRGHHPRLSADGTWLYYERPGETPAFLKIPGTTGQTRLAAATNLYRRRVDGGTEALLARDVANPGASFDLSPDGRTLVFTTMDRNGSTLHALDPGVGNPRVLFHAPGIYTPLAPRFSPVDGRVAFIAGSDLMVVSAEGGPPRRLASSPSWQPEIAWAPDGQRLAAIAQAGPRRVAVLVIELETGASRAASPAGEDAWDKEGLSWSPDGEALTYLCYSCAPPSEAGAVGEEIRIVRPGADRSERWVSMPESYEWPLGWVAGGPDFLFLRYADEGISLYRRTATGTHVFMRELVGVPVWSADGMRMAWEGGGPPG